MFLVNSTLTKAEVGGGVRERGQEKKKSSHQIAVCEEWWGQKTKDILGHRNEPPQCETS